MAKGISPLISTVIVIMMVVASISMVLFIGRPTIDKAIEASVVNEASLNMKAIDTAIKEVASEGVQSSRTVTFKVSDGSYRIVNGSGVLFEKELLQPVYSFNTITFDGYVKSAAGVNPLGLIGFWKFDEGGGSVANDSSGNGNSGTISGTTWTTGKFGNALNFNGSSGNYVNVSVIKPNGTYSVSAWVYKNSITAHQYIFDARTSDTVGTGYLYWDYTTVTLHYSSGGASYVDGVTTNILGSGAWHYVVVSGITLNITSNFVIGSRYSKEISWNGTIDEVRIYNRALSASEIKDDYKADPNHYYIALDYDRIQVIGTDIWQKGNQKLCIEKIGETGNKAVVEVRTC